MCPIILIFKNIKKKYICTFCDNDWYWNKNSCYFSFFSVLFIPYLLDVTKLLVLKAEQWAVLWNCERLKGKPVQKLATKFVLTICYIKFLTERFISFE